MASTASAILAAALAGTVMLAGRVLTVPNLEPRALTSPELVTLFMQPRQFTSLAVRPATTYRMEPDHRLTIEFLWAKRHGHWWTRADALCAATATAGECYRVWHKREAVYRFDTLDAAGRVTESEDFRLLAPAPANNCERVKKP